jgi:hypothetical protein
MSCQRSTVGKAKGLILGCASLLVGAPVTCASAQGAPPDPIQAIKNAMDEAARRNELQQVPPGQPGVPAGELPAAELGFVLSGVVIAGETRLALLQGTAANSGPARLLPVGTSLAGHRILDIQPDRVTLEGQSGEKVTVRLGAGGGPGTGVPGSVTMANRQASLPPVGEGGALPSAPRPERAEQPQPASGGDEVEEPDSVQEKEARQARLAERKAADKARDLAQ